MPSCKLHRLHCVRTRITGGSAPHRMEITSGSALRKNKELNMRMRKKKSLSRSISILIVLTLAASVLLLGGCAEESDEKDTGSKDDQIENQIEEQTADQAENQSEVQADDQTEEQAEDLGGSQAENRTESQPVNDAEDQAEGQAEKEEITMNLKINDTPVAVKWENNDSVTALQKLAAEKPIVIDMSMYGGFEQVGSIGKTLPSSDRQTKTSAGDIVLYTSSQLVVFYGSNSWAYTRLGKITDKSKKELKDLLGSGDVTITIEP